MNDTSRMVRQHGVTIFLWCVIASTGCYQRNDADLENGDVSEAQSQENRSETEGADTPVLSEEEKAEREATIKDLMKRALEHENRGDNKTARDHYQKIVDIDPSYMDGWYNLGRMELRDPVDGLESYRRGIRMLDRALELTDRGANVHYVRGKLRERIGEATGNRGEIRLAVADYDRAIEIFDNDPNFYLTRALANYSLGNYDASHADNQYIVQRSEELGAGDPGNLKEEARRIYNFALLNNVNTLSAAGRHDEAVEWGEKAAKYGRGIPNAHRNKATAYLTRADNQSHSPADYEKAVEGYTETIHLLPEWSYPWHDRGVALSRLHRFHEAEASLGMAGRLGGVSERWVRILFRCWEAMGDYDSVFQMQERLGRDRAADLQLAWTEACVERNAGLFERAEQHFKSIAQANSDVLEAQIVLAEMELAQGATDAFHSLMLQALEAVKRESEAKPQSTRPYVQLARIQEMRGLNDEAIRWYEEELAADPANVHALHNLAWIVVTHPDEQRRNVAKARELMEAALTHAERDTPAMLDTMACIEAASGNFDRAVEIQAKAMADAPNEARHRYLLRRIMYEKKLTYAESPGPKSPKWLPLTMPKAIVDPNNLSALRPSENRDAVSLTRVAEMYYDAIVMIKSPYGNDVTGNERFGYSSGAILDPSGYVLTHAHPLPYMGNVEVTYFLPGEGPQADRKRTAVAEVIGLDRFSGLALLKFKPDGELAHVEFDIRSEVSDGDAVAAIGWSLQDAEEFGQQTVQSDVRHSGQRVHYRNLIQLSNQHDASFIGSPLLSERGKVVGIVSKSGMSPIECAVPMSDVLRFLGVDDSEPVQ